MRIGLPREEGRLCDGLKSVEQGLGYGRRGRAGGGGEGGALRREEPRRTGTGVREEGTGAEGRLYAALTCGAQGLELREEGRNGAEGRLCDGLKSVEQGLGYGRRGRAGGGGEGGALRREEPRRTGTGVREEGTGAEGRLYAALTCGAQGLELREEGRNGAEGRLCDGLKSVEQGLGYGRRGRAGGGGEGGALRREEPRRTGTGVREEGMGAEGRLYAALTSGARGLELREEGRNGAEGQLCDGLKSVEQGLELREEGMKREGRLYAALTCGAQGLELREEGMGGGRDDLGEGRGEGGANLNSQFKWGAIIWEGVRY